MLACSVTTMSELQPPTPASETTPPGVGIAEGLAVEHAADEMERRERRFGRLRGGSLRQHAARGTVVNAMFMIGLTSLGFIKGFILAAFVSREDYGIWGIVIIAIGTLMWLKQVGIGDKYIQQDEDDQEAAFHKAFTLELMLACVFAALLITAVPIMAWLYGQPEIILPGLAIVLTIPAGMLQAGQWVYYRRMDFLRQRALAAVDPVVGFVVGVSLAIAGAGYWALIAAAVVGPWASALVTLRFSPYKLKIRYDKGALRSYATFSWPLFVATAGGLVIAQTSVLTTEDALGVAGVGALMLASTITQFTDRVDGLITSTLYPAICAVADRTALLHESFVKSNRLALMWAIPFGVALSLFASDLVHLAIGDEWIPAIGLIQVMGLVAAAGHIGFNWDAYYRAIGKTRPMAVAATVAAVTFLACIPLIYEYGLRGVGWAVMAQMVAHVSVRAFFLRRLFEGFALARHAVRAVLPTIPAVGVVLLVRMAFDGERNLLQAGGELSLYLLVTAAFTWVFERNLLKEAVGYMRSRPEPAGA